MVEMIMVVIMIIMIVMMMMIIVIMMLSAKTMVGAEGMVLQRGDALYITPHPVIQSHTIHPIYITTMLYPSEMTLFDCLHFG